MKKRIEEAFIQQDNMGKILPKGSKEEELTNNSSISHQAEKENKDLKAEGNERCFGKCRRIKVFHPAR